MKAIMIAVAKTGGHVTERAPRIVDLRNSMDRSSRETLRVLQPCRKRWWCDGFETHGLTGNIAYSGDDTFSLVSLVSAGLGTGFASEWTKDLPDSNFELWPVCGVDLKIGLGVARNNEGPTAWRNDVIDIARSLARPGR